MEEWNFKKEERVFVLNPVWSCQHLIRPQEKPLFSKVTKGGEKLLRELKKEGKNAGQIVSKMFQEELMLYSPEEYKKEKEKKKKIVGAFLERNYSPKPKPKKKQSSVAAVKPRKAKSPDSQFYLKNQAFLIKKQRFIEENQKVKEKEQEESRKQIRFISPKSKKLARNRSFEDLLAKKKELKLPPNPKSPTKNANFIIKYAEKMYSNHNGKFAKKSVSPEFKKIESNTKSTVLMLEKVHNTVNSAGIDNEKEWVSKEEMNVLLIKFDLISDSKPQFSFYAGRETRKKEETVEEFRKEAESALKGFKAVLSLKLTFLFSNLLSLLSAEHLDSLAKTKFAAFCSISEETLSLISKLKSDCAPMLEHKRSVEMKRHISKSPPKDTKPKNKKEINLTHLHGLHSKHAETEQKKHYERFLQEQDKEENEMKECKFTPAISELAQQMERSLENIASPRETVRESETREETVSDYKANMLDPLVFELPEGYEDNKIKEIRLKGKLKRETAENKEQFKPFVFENEKASSKVGFEHYLSKPSKEVILISVKVNAKITDNLRLRGTEHIEEDIEQFANKHFLNRDKRKALRQMIADRLNV